MAGTLLIPPHGLTAVKATFGNFTYTDTDGGWVIPDKKWVRNNIVTVEVGEGEGARRFQLHKLVADLAVQALAEACKETGYVIRKIGGHAPRHQLNNPKNPLSLHSWGIALDINWDTNGIGLSAPCDLPPRFIEVMEAHGFAWGGRFRNNDKMHFQFATGC